MNINLDNYQAYFLDYFEQSLNPQETAELMLFLEQHPGLKEEFDSFEPVSLIPDLSIHFPEKDQLKKAEIKSCGAIHAKNYEEYLIAAVENILTPSETLELEAFLAANPHLNEEMSLFLQTRLEPDMRIVFDDKESLKRKALVFTPPAPASVAPARRILQPWMYRAVAIAAVLLIFFAVYLNINTTGPADQLARQDNPRTPVVTAPRTQESPETQPAETPATQSPDANSPAETGSRYGKTMQPAHQEVRSMAPEMTFASLTPRSAPLFPEASAAAGINTENRNYFTDIYTYIRLREEMDYLEYRYARENQPVLARAFGNFKEKVLGVDMKDAQNTRNDGFWALAEAGLDGINFLTRSNLQLNRRTDDEGKTLSYAIRSGRMEYSRDLK